MWKLIYLLLTFLWYFRPGSGVLRPCMKQGSAIRMFAQDTRGTFSRQAARRKTLKESVMSPASGSAISAGTQINYLKCIAYRGRVLFQLILWTKILFNDALCRCTIIRSNALPTVNSCTTFVLKKTSIICFCIVHY